MYLVNKLCGVRIGRMYVPACLKEYTTNVVSFVLSSPGVDNNKAEFKTEGEKLMETQENRAVEELIEEIKKQTSDDNSDNEADESNAPEGHNLMDAILPLMLRALMHNAIMTKEVIMDLDKRTAALEQKVEALENKKCACEKNESGAAAA